MRLTVLGSGHSTGVPMAGGYWGECDPDNPRNHRKRVSALVEHGNTKLIIDTGPDFREQTLHFGITDIDGVLYTHAHGDHVNGIDDLRAFRYLQKNKIPIWGSQSTIDEIVRHFKHLFVSPDPDIYTEILEHHIVTDEDFYQPYIIDDISFVAFKQNHRVCTTTGYRFGDVAYSTDVFDLDDMALDTLRGIKVWIVDCADEGRGPGNWVHANLDKIKMWNQVISANKVYLTHLCPRNDYNELLAKLPVGYEPAYDGLVIDI